MRASAALIAVALLPATALAAPPPTRMQPGLWKFHYHSSVQMGGRSMPPMDKTGEHCVKDTDPAKLPLMPNLPPNVQCTPPQLQSSDKGYHVTMSCKASEASGMVSKLDEDFMISPSDDGSKLAIDGTVHQQITGGPIPIPAAVVTISAQGQRVGMCPAARG